MDERRIGRSVFALNGVKMEFKKGDRVVFTRNKPHYRLGPSNPLIGSEWYCEGTVCDFNIYNIHVYWDNGCRNNYIPECLDFVVGKYCPDELPDELFEI